MSEISHYSPLPENLTDHRYAHPLDSLAPAEHIDWRAVDERLQHALTLRARPANKLQWAWLCTEYALAIADTDRQNQLLDMAQGLATEVAEQKLPHRGKTRVNAMLLASYADVFRLRAARETITDDHKQTLQKDIGAIMLDYIHEGDEMQEQDYGLLSELIVPYMLLEYGRLAYLASDREECNIMPDDNHDYYTLHGCHQNGLRKVPISVKHSPPPAHLKLREPVYDYEPILTLTIGSMAISAGKQLNAYADDMRDAQNNAQRWRGTRLAADIIACHTLDDALSFEDRRFMVLMGQDIKHAVDTFAARDISFDYAHNAQTIEDHLAMTATAHPNLYQS